MNKYCTNCGKKLHEGADLCMNCGKFVIKVPNNNDKNQSEKTISIVGMILGIIGFIIGLSMMLEISEMRSSSIEDEIYVRIICGLIMSVFPLAPSIPALVLSLLGINKQKSTFGIIGLISGIIGILFGICTIVYLIY